MTFGSENWAELGMLDSSLYHLEMAGVVLLRWGIQLGLTLASGLEVGCQLEHPHSPLYGFYLHIFSSSMCFVFMCILEGEFKFHYQIAGIFLQK
jgi:hypothetical protein